MFDRGMELEFFVLLFGLFVVAGLYSSVGHGGASGYLAVLSITTYGTMEAAWLKQHAWCLNLVVASIAFFHFYRSGHHNSKLTIPFIIGSIPMAIIGGYLVVDGAIYDLLLSICLVIAAWRLLVINTTEINETKLPNMKNSIPIGGSIGLISGIIGVGGGIFLSPILLLKRWATPKGVAATSSLFIWVNSLSGLGGAVLSNQLILELDILIPFVFVVMIGGFIGSKYGAEIAPQKIVRILLVVVLLIASMKRIIEMF
jgi:uncharacterized membrane protein YfcA